MATLLYRGIPIKERTPENVRDALQNQDKETIRAFLNLHKYATENHLGLSALANETRIPSSILSACFNGLYDKGNYNRITERIQAFFWRLEQKALYGGLREFKTTRLAKTLWAAFDKTRVIRRIQIIQGPEQVGKTRAAKEYAARNNSGRTVMVSLSGGTRSGCGDFIWNTAAALDIPSTIKMRDKRLRIRRTLACCDLFMIDEAHIPFRAWTDSDIGMFLDYIRTDIFDNGARGVVMFVTNSDFLKNLQAWRKRHVYNIGQMLGRMRNETMKIDPAEDIIEDDVRMLVERYYKPGSRAIKSLHKLATREQLGHFGLLDDVMNEAWTTARSRKKALTDDIVISTIKQTMNTLKSREELYS